jgi:hypothetical protein
MHTHQATRALAGLLAAVAVATAVSGPVAAGPVAARAPAAPDGVAGTGGAAVPALAWRDCDPGFQCATATVPRDYAHPRGPTIELAVIR